MDFIWRLYSRHYASITQLEERRSSEPSGEGSTPSGGFKQVCGSEGGASACGAEEEGSNPSYLMHALEVYRISTKVYETFRAGSIPAKGIASIV